jgi:hypothetical protein
MVVDFGGSADRVKTIKEILTVHTQMSLVRVWTDTGNNKPSALLAKIVEHKTPVYVIRYLSRTDEEHKGCTIWRYEDETYEIDDDSITEWLETDDELEVGFKSIGDGFIFYDSDADYVPSDEDEDSTSDEDEACEFSDEFNDDESEYDDED